VNVRKLPSFLCGVSVVALVGCGPAPSVEEGASGLFRQLPGSCAESPLAVASARASAEENNHFHASFAVDGDETTRWSSGRANTAWLVLDLGQRETIRSLSIDWERAFSPSFWIQASDNAVNWATLDIDAATQPGVMGIPALDATARYLRILSQRPSSFGNVSIFEADVFGDANTGCLATPASCGAPILLPISRARASSQQFSYTPAAGAVDGVYSTRWSSNFTDNEWLSIDLGNVARIDSVRITWEHAFARRYALQTSDSFDGPWTTAVTIDDGSFGTTLSPSIGVNARFLRMLGLQRATQYGYSIWELDVYGSRQLICP
jgi:hypothetical protein